MSEAQHQPGESAAIADCGDGPGTGARATSTGGAIPGLAGAPAFTLHVPTPAPVPVLIAVPHAGRDYPAQTIAQLRHPSAAALKLEDRFADLLGRDVAARTGAWLLVAHAPRALIDLNRCPDDVDWSMFGDARLSRRLGSGAGPRARSGLGLVPRRVPGLGELWRARHSVADLDARLAQIHEPYHAALARALAALRRRWGAALLIDLHSMPPLGARDGRPSVSVVIGDRFGASCHGGLVGAAFAELAATKLHAALNRPYAGGYCLTRHAQPHAGLHALQVEIDRSLYLDAGLDNPGPGYAAMVDRLCALVRRLAGETAALGSDAATGWAEAAE